MSYLQKIVYPSASVQSSGGVTLSFVKPARNVNPYGAEALRDDDYSSYGDHEAVVERIDHFIEFDMPWIEDGADVDAWVAFLDAADEGIAFDWYPDQAVDAYTTCHLVSKGVRPRYRSPGWWQMSTLRLRKIVV